MEELLADAITIDGCKEWCCRFLIRNERLDNVEVSQVQDGHPRLCCKVNTCKQRRQRVVAAGLNLRPQAQVRIKCWLFRPSAPRSRSCGKQLNSCWRVKGGNFPCSSKKEVKK